MPSLGMQVPLRTIAAVFSRLGLFAFGGPAAHIAVMHVELVRRRGWLSDQEFADLLAATNLMPGPNSTEMAIHIGRRVGGWRGLLVAGACFILPAALIVSVLAAIYVRYGRTPDARALLAGISPVIVAIIAQAVLKLAHSSLRRSSAWLVAIGSSLFALAGYNELIVLMCAGVVSIAASHLGSAALAILVSLPLVAQAAAQTRAPGADDVTLTKLTLFFLKVGSVLYGSGYVLVAFLRADLVDRWHWLTDQQLLDAIAVGQVTPGPLFTTATFIGFFLAGWPGAILSTLAIFLPAFVFVAVSQPLIPRLRQSATAAAFLDGVVAASLGLMIAVAVTLGRAVLTDAIAWTELIASVVVLVRWNVNSAWLIACGASVGLLRLS
jgi:chromate transporter